MNFWRAGKRAFMSFWYPYVGVLNEIWPSITIKGKRLVIAREVYKPLENEYACARYCNEGDRVLDLGCGSGVGAVFCAPKAREVVAVDISQAAVKNTEENCRIHGLTNVKVLQSDMFSNVEGKFDLILANPPYIELEVEGEDTQFATSVRYMPVLFENVGEHLVDGGLLLVQFPIWFRKKVERLASGHGLELIEVKRTPLKSPSLLLLSLAYMQFGFRSAYYLWRYKPEAAAPSLTEKAA